MAFDLSEFPRGMTHRMHFISVVARPVTAALTAALLLGVLAPMAPQPGAGAGPVKVRAAETTAAVSGTRVFDISPDATHVAIHWAGHPDALVTAAFSKDGKAFSKPRAVEVEDADGAPDGAVSTNETYGTLIGIDSIRVVRIHTDRPLASLTVLALDAAGPEPLSLGMGSVAEGATTMPPIISRAQWGADESLRFDAAGDEQWPREYFPAQKLVVHHTAGRNNDPDPAATVRAIYYYHAVTRRWADIGYNYLIDEQGRIYEGRYARDFWNGELPSSDDTNGLAVAGGHAKYYNQGSIGISLMGTFTSQAPTAAAHASLVKLLAWLAAKYHLDPHGASTYVNPNTGASITTNNIGGHRDYANTSCPGAVLYAQLPAIRNEVAAAINSWPGETFNPQRTVSVSAGTYVGRTFSSTGAITASLSSTLSSNSSAQADQSANVPTQSGTWYHMTSGVWAGYWIQQSAGITLGAAPPVPALTRYETARPLSVPAGTYVGRKFDTYGTVTSTKSSTLSGSPTIWTIQKGTIPSQAGSWYYVTVGALEGYWIPESGGMTLGGPPPPFPAPIAIYNPPGTVRIAPGTYVGRRFSQYGISAGTWTATVKTADSAPTSRYSTLPGQSGKWYYIIDGEFESYWLLEQPGIVGPGALTTDLIFDSTGYFVPDASGATFVPLTPARLLDTRVANGLSGAFAAGTPRTFQVSGRGGVPANATAVTGNLTVTGQTKAGYAFLGPNPIASPTSSTLNFPLADSRANGVTVALGAGGSLSATYLAPAGATTHLIFDVTGYFVPDASGATFVPLAPARLLDTRVANGLSGAFAANVARTFQVTGLGGVPANATAVTGNLTVTGQSKVGYAFLGPNPIASPTSSTLNFPLADSRANGVTVALSGSGSLSATYVATAGATAHLIFDVTGYFVPGASGATFVPLTPARLLDTRVGNGLSGPFSAGAPRTFQITGLGGVPANATAVTGNLTVTGQSTAGYAFLGPTPTTTPATSTLNFPVGDSRANGVTVALGAGGSLSATYIHQ